MNFIPIGAKQIAFVSYDDQAARMEVQYHTGRRDTITGVCAEEIQSLIRSYNPYEAIVRLTESRGPEPTPTPALTPISPITL